MTKRKKVALGKPLPPIPDDAELVSQSDIDAAMIRASRLGDDIFNALVNAEPVEDEGFITNA